MPTRSIARLLPLALTALAGAACAASPIEGLWQVRFACPHQQAEACRTGTPESFTLRLRVEGRTVCGVHSSVAQFGQRVDEPLGEDASVTGTLAGQQARLRFVSSYGGQGAATVWLQRGRLHWRVDAQEAGESWLPPGTVLRRAHDDRWHATLRCAQTRPAP